MYTKKGEVDGAIKGCKVEEVVVFEAIKAINMSRTLRNCVYGFIALSKYLNPSISHLNSNQEPMKGSHNIREIQNVPWRR